MDFTGTLCLVCEALLRLFYKTRAAKQHFQKATGSLSKSPVVLVPLSPLAGAGGDSPRVPDGRRGVWLVD